MSIFAHFKMLDRAIHHCVIDDMVRIHRICNVMLVNFLNGPAVHPSALTIDRASHQISCSYWIFRLSGVCLASRKTHGMAAVLRIALNKIQWQGHQINDANRNFTRRYARQKRLDYGGRK
jgi:hypothetical protein